MKHRLILLTAALAAAASFSAFAEEPVPSISVTGRGIVSAAVDTAEMTVSIETTAKTQEEAAAQNAERTRAVRTALIAAGAEFNALATGNYSVNPDYRYDRKGKATLEGYTAVNSITVKVRQLRRVGEVIDAAAANGAARIDSVRFYNENKLPYKNQALLAAARDARKEAETVAAALGRTLGPVISASETGNYTMRRPPRLFLAKAVNSSAAASTPAEGADEEISVSLDVTFTLQ